MAYAHRHAHICIKKKISKNKDRNGATHLFNFRTQKVEAGRSLQIRSQSHIHRIQQGLHSEGLPLKKQQKPTLKSNREMRTTL